MGRYMHTKLQRIHNKNGFTIVELLIVVVVIAILAAVTIVSYNGIQNRSAESVLKSELSSVTKQLEIDKIRNSESLYPSSLDAAKGGQGITLTSDTTLEYTYDEPTNTFCLSATSSRSGVSGFHVSSDSKIIQEGVCEGHIPPGGVVAKVWTKVSVGNEFACGIANGEAYCWGFNGNGRLGDGTTTQSSVPVKVTQAPGLLEGKTVTDIAAGGSHVCAIADGAVYCWRNGASGKLGDNGVTDRYEPVAVLQESGALLGKTVTRVSAGGSLTCAVASGEAFCWGANSNGQIGDGTTTQRNKPTKVTQASGYLLGKTVTDISAGSNPYACAVASGEAFCWGFNSSGVLGDNSQTQRTTPVKVTQSNGILLGKTVTRIDASGSVTCAVASDESYCWGYGGQYQLATGGTSTSLVPVKVTQSAGILQGTTATRVVPGTNVTCAVASGEAFCWGKSNYGGLGKAGTTTATTPIKVTVDPGVLEGKTVTDIDSSSGQDANCVIASGAPYCWGKNDYGQLGNDSTTSSYVPVPVTF